MCLFIILSLYRYSFCTATYKNNNSLRPLNLLPFSCGMIALARSAAQSARRCQLPHACLREHMTVSRTRCRPSLVHACDRLPVATGRRRLALLRCSEVCVRLSSRLATCVLCGGGRRLCQRLRQAWCHTPYAVGASASGRLVLPALAHRRERRRSTEAANKVT